MRTMHAFVMWMGFGLLLISQAVGCTRLRFVVDAVPAEESITETTVLDDQPSNFLSTTSRKIALIDVQGLIVDARSNQFLSSGENPVDRFAESLDRAAGDADVKAVIIRLNSPGGAVTASDVMYRLVQRFKEDTRKPVVMLMSDVAASGAFYLSCAGDYVIAHPTTVTGSIGVIIQTVNFSEGMARIGIRADAITSGENKAMGSPFEPMPASHRALLQGIVDEFFGQFRDIVVQSHPALDESDLQWVTDGRVITGKRAAEIGLVDATGDFHDAVDKAKELANVNIARVVKYHRPLEHVASPWAAAPVGAGATNSQVNLMQVTIGQGPWSQPMGFYYLWDPTAW
jgi:protease-4